MHAIRTLVVSCALAAASIAQAGTPICPPACTSGPGIVLEWRPAQTTVPVGGIVELGLYAVPVPAKSAPQIAGVQGVITWDPAILHFLGIHNDGPYEWLVSDLLDDSGLDDVNAGLNAPPVGVPDNDGNLYYEAQSQLPAPVGVGPPALPGEGLLLTGFRFEALVAGSSVVDIVPEFGMYTCTAAFPGTGEPACDMIVDLLVAEIDVVEVNPIVSSVPPDGAVDARQPTTIDGTIALGWHVIDLTFAAPPTTLTIADLELTAPCGATPSITELAVAGLTATLTLDGPLPAGTRTTIRHLPSDSQIILGVLPGDVDGDGTSSALDILALIDVLNGAASRPEWSTDINHTGLTEPLDILRLIDLLNGAEAFDTWNQVSFCD